MMRLDSVRMGALKSGVCIEPIPTVGRVSGRWLYRSS